MILASSVQVSQDNGYFVVTAVCAIAVIPLSLRFASRCSKCYCRQILLLETFRLASFSRGMDHGSERKAVVGTYKIHGESLVFAGLDQ